MKPRATPFDGLLGLVPGQLPKTKSGRVVVAGQAVTNVTKIDALLGADDPARQELREAVRAKAKARSRKRNPRNDTEEARERNREYMRQYMAVWRAKPENQARERELKAAWKRRQYHADIEAARAAQREWYARNREAVLARNKAKKLAARQAKAKPVNPNDERTVE